MKVEEENTSEDKTPDAMTDFVDVIKKIERLKDSTRKKMEAINDFYSQQNGETFRQPMMVHNGKVGGDNRGNFPQQENAFFIAYHFYCYFSTPALIPFLKRPQTLLGIIDYILTHKYTPSLKQSSAPQGSLILEQFYPAFVEFIDEISALQTTLKKIPEEHDAWLNTVKWVFKEQCEALLARGKFNPLMFDQTLELVTLLDSEFALDIDDLIKLKNCFSVYGDASVSFHFDAVSGKMIRNEKDPQLIVKHFAKYLETKIQSKDIVNLYHTIFLEVVEMHRAKATAEAATLAQKSGSWQPTNFQAHHQQPKTGDDTNTDPAADSSNFINTKF
ncbi:MAG: hypothetical protein M3R00_03820 [Pseudomonadota bacterium]|nr:hypothetical protein [Pseudomonadota bacterium]